MVGASRPPLGVCASPHLSSLSLLVKKRESLLVTKTKLLVPPHTRDFILHSREGRGVASRRPPLGVCLFLSLLAVSRRFSQQPSHATSPVFSPLSLVAFLREGVEDVECRAL